MSVAVLCACCNRGSRIPEELLGKNVQCPYCYDVFEAVRDPQAPPLPEPKPSRAAAPEPVMAELVADGEAAAPPPPPIVPPEEILTVEAVPAPAVRPFPPIRFVALITRDPDGVLKGRMLAEVNADGLRLRRQDGRNAVLSPVGHAARHLGQNRLAVTVQGREVQMLVFKANARQERLARDVAAFLNGRRPSLNPHDYSAVWYLVVAALLPLGLPLFGIPLNLMNGAAGVTLWLTLALALVGGGLFFGLRSWHPGARFASIAGVVAAGYLFLLLAPTLGLAAPPRIENWRPFSPPDASFTIQMPLAPTWDGKPRTEPAWYGNLSYQVYVADLPTHQAAFSAASIDLNAAGVPPPEPNRLFDERTQSIQQRNNVPGFGIQPGKPLLLYNRYPGREVVFRGGKVNGTLTVQMYLVKGRLYILSAAGGDARAHERESRKFFDSFALPPAAQAAAQARSPADLQGLLLYLPFEEADGNQAFDQPRGLSAVVSNVDRIDGVKGRALRFRGQGSRVDYEGAHPNFGANAEFTIAGWVRNRDNQGTVLAQRQRNNPLTKLQLRLWNDSLLLTFHTGNERDDDLNVTGKVPITDGLWHHFAVTRSFNGRVQLYLDGALQGGDSKPNSKDSFSTDLRSLGCDRYQVEVLGKNGPNENFVGDLDEFCVFNRELKLDEIKGLAAGAR